MKDSRRTIGAHYCFALSCCIAVSLTGMREVSAQRVQNREESAQPLSELIYTSNSALYRNFSYALRRNDHSKALTIVQAILDLPDDAFVSDELGSARSLKKLAFEYIESLTRDQLRAYQRERDVDAEILLSEAQASGNVRDYFSILERYYFTASGFEATDWLASRALDLGRYRSAARLWNELIDSSVHLSKVDAPVLLKAAIANRLSGQGERAAELMQRLQSTPPGRGLSDRLEAYLASVSRQNTSPPSENRFSLPTEWSLSLVDPLNADERRFLDDWRHQHWSEGRYPLFVNRNAVVVGGMLCVRDYNNLVFADLETGKVNARYSMYPRLEQIAENYVDSRSGPQSRFRHFSDTPDFREYFTWNTLHGQLSHDETHVYLIEGDESWAKGNRLRPGERFRVRVGERNAPNPDDPVPVNSLVAFSISDKPSPQGLTTPDWKIDEQSQDIAKPFFLAPPVNIDGVLYTLAEVEKNIRLLGLDPNTGRVLWSQGVAIPPNSLFEDQDRRMRGCAIVEAGGFLVVTTQVGLVVCLDPLRRTLEWAYYIGEADGRRRGGLFGNNLTSYNYLGFPDRPLVDGDRVLLLPRQSSHLHCLDLKTGERLWNPPPLRNGRSTSSEPSDGDEYLGGVLGNTLLVVGTTRSRGVNLADGQELWDVNHKRISGIGVLNGTEYLLPLETSQLLRIDLATGQSREFSLDGVETHARNSSQGIEGDHTLDQSQAPLPEFGHLMLVDHRLISLGLEQVRCLTEPVVKLNSLKLAARQHPLTPQQRWEQALLAPPRDVEFRTQLLAELSAELSPENELSKKVRNDYKELLFVRLQQDSSLDESLANSLSQLLETADERIRYLILRSRLQRLELNFTGVLESLQALSQLQSSSLFPSPDDPHLMISLGAWNRELWDWAMSELTEQQRDQFETFLQAQINAALASNNPIQNSQLIERFPGLPQLDPVRYQLALQSIDSDAYHAAEMLLLTVSNRTQSSELKQQATEELARMWTQFGEYAESAALLEGTESSDRDAIERLRTNPQFDRAWKNLHPFLSSPQQVQIRSLPPGLRQATIRRQYEYFRIFQTPHDCNFNLLAERKALFSESRFASNNFRAEGRDAHILKIISRTRGTIDAEIEIPNRASSTAGSENAVVGHFFPLGSPGQVRGLSLIDVADNKPIWTRSFLEPEMSDMLFVGPSNSEYVTFRNPDTLLCLDSRTGHVLWRRNALAPRTGFSNGKMPKLFGDHKAIVRLGDDEDPLAVFESFTGREIKPTVEVSRTGMHGAVGRFAVQVRYQDANSRVDVSRRRPRLVVIDMETGEVVWSSFYWNSECFELIRDRLVLITPQRDLKVLNLRTFEQELSIALTVEECTGVTNLEFFSDAENLYINIGRINDQNAALRTTRYSQAVSNAFLPTIRIEGLLIAVDRKTGNRRWSRMLPACAILESPYERLPFLVSLSKLTRQRIPNIQRLQVEAISLEDGSRLGVTDDFVPLDQYTALYHTSYDSEAGLFELHGPMYHATIRFTPLWERLPEVPEPF